MKKVFVLYLLAAFLGSAVRAQTCNGSVGDPTALIDFGSGGGSGSYPGIVSGYEFAPGSCPIEGQYSIASAAFFCFSNSWHTVPGDHTPGDQNGKMLIVNAGNKGPLLTQTINGLCSGTTYVVNEYSMNLMKDPPCGPVLFPSLEFIIESTSGTVLTSYQTGNLGQNTYPTWVNGSFIFDCPAGVTSVVLKINSLNPGGCGNVFAIDDISFSPCGPLVQVGFNGLATDNLHACPGKPANFVLQGQSSGGYANPYYQWEVRSELQPTWAFIPGANSSSYNVVIPSVSGTFEYRLIVANGFAPSISDKCVIVSKTITIAADNAIFLNATTYLYGCYGSDVPFQASGASEYLWTGPNGFTSTKQNPVVKSVTYADAGLYTVKGTLNGCSDTVSALLTVSTAPTGTASFYEADVCEGKPLQLNAAGGPRYSWFPRKPIFNNDTIANPIVTLKDTTLLTCVVFSVPGCDDTVRIKVNVWKNPIADAGPDRRVRLGSSIQIAGKSDGTDVKYYWTPGSYLDNANTLNPVTTPPVDMLYALHVESDHGCKAAIDEMKVRVFDKIIIPNTFTPNGDGVNDYWEIRDLDVFTDAIIEVYNTAGQRVYRSTGYDKAWDGTMNGRPLPVGTYYYAINLKEPKMKPMVGYVTIIR